MAKKRFNLFGVPAFSRRWWLREGRNLFWVIVITIFIWVYADLQFTDKMDLRATIHFTTDNNPNLVLRTPADVDVTFTIVGSRNTLENFRRKLTSGGAELTYDLSAGYGPGENPILTRDIIARAMKNAMAGISIESASPDIIRVNLEELVLVKDVPVDFDYTGGTLAGPATIKPEKINLRIAKSDWVSLRERSGGKPRIRTTPVDLTKIPTGEPYTWENLELAQNIDGDSVRPEPTVVTVTAEVTQREDTAEITVPLSVLSPPGWIDAGTWQDYTLVLEDPSQRRLKIRVTGAKKDIDRLRDPKFVQQNVQAYIIPREEDKLAASMWPGAVHVSFAPGLDVHLAGEVPTVRYKLEKTTAP